MEPGENKENTYEFTEIMAAPTTMSKLPFILTGLQREKVKSISESIEAEKVKISLVLERHDNQRKRKLEASLNECESRVAKMAAVRSRQHESQERVAESAKLIIDSLNDSVSGSTLGKELTELKEITEAFVESDQKVIEENMKLVESLLDLLVTQNNELITDILEKSPNLAREKDYLSSPESSKEKEIKWKLKLIRIAGTIDPLKEDMQQADEMKQELLKKFAESSEEVNLKNNILMDMINKLDDINENQIRSEEEEIENLKRSFENDREEGYKEVFKINMIIMDKQNELIELREKISVMKEVAREKAEWNEKLAEAEANYLDVAADYDCIFTEYDEEQKAESELLNLVEAEENQLQEDEQQQEMRLAQVTNELEEIKKEMETIRLELEEKIRKDEKSEINLKNLEANLEKINGEINRIQDEKKQKRDRKRAKKKEFQQLEAEFNMKIME